MEFGICHLESLKNMCRFLLLKSKFKVNSQHIIEHFSDMAQKSKALDGDWQGDGWGISWLDENNNWSIYTSVSPIWEETSHFARIPETSFLVIHARSASFPQDKNNIHYNQPYLDDNYVFVFNGLLKGVTIPFQAEGKIGAQKTWFLLTKFLRNKSPEKALRKLKELMIANAKKIIALNIGLCDKKSIYVFTMYEKHPEYYRLQLHQSKDLIIVSSEAIQGYDFSGLANGIIKKF